MELYHLIVIQLHGSASRHPTYTAHVTQKAASHMAMDEPAFDHNLDEEAPSFEQVDRASQTTHFALLSVEELTANHKMLQ